MRQGATTTRSTASVGVAALAWLVIFVSATIAASVLIAVTGHTGDDRPEIPFWVTGLSLLAQWTIAIVVLWWVSRNRISGHPMSDYRWRFKPVDLIGIPIGVLSQLVLLELVYWPLGKLFEDQFNRDRIEQPARELTDPTHGLWKLALVVAVVVCAPIVEETLYRGLIQGSLQARLADALAVVLAALWFAAVHIQGVQLPGLFTFGLVLGICFQRTDRLGMGVLAHAAFNATSLAVLW